MLKKWLFHQKTEMKYQKNYSDAHIVVEGTITVEGDDDNKKEIKSHPLRIMIHLDHAYQKSIIPL